MSHNWNQKPNIYFLYVKLCDISNSASFSSRSKVVLSDMDIENHEIVTLFQKNEREILLVTLLIMTPN